VEEFLSHTKEQIILLVRGLTELENQKKEAFDKSQNQHYNRKDKKSRHPPKTESDYVNLEHWFNNIQMCKTKS